MRLDCRPVIVLAALLVLSCQGGVFYANGPDVVDQESPLRPASRVREKEPRLAGSVFDGVTGVPLSGVLISLASRAVVTDERGRYVLGNIRPGTYFATATKPGFAATTREVTIRTDTPNVVNFTLDPAR